jgi:hypothetical protein
LDQPDEYELALGWQPTGPVVLIHWPATQTRRGSTTRGQYEYRRHAPCRRGPSSRRPWGAVRSKRRARPRASGIDDLFRQAGPPPPGAEDDSWAALPGRPADASGGWIHPPLRPPPRCMDIRFVGWRTMRFDQSAHLGRRDGRAGTTLVGIHPGEFRPWRRTRPPAPPPIRWPRSSRGPGDVPAAGPPAPGDVRLVGSSSTTGIRGARRWLPSAPQGFWTVTETLEPGAAIAICPCRMGRNGRTPEGGHRSTRTTASARKTGVRDRCPGACNGRGAPDRSKQPRAATRDDTHVSLATVHPLPSPLAIPGTSSGVPEVSSCRCTSPCRSAWSRPNLNAAQRWLVAGGDVSHMMETGRVGVAGIVPAPELNDPSSHARPRGGAFRRRRLGGRFRHDADRPRADDRAAAQADVRPDMRQGLVKNGPAPSGSTWLVNESSNGRLRGGAENWWTAHSRAVAPRQQPAARILARSATDPARWRRRRGPHRTRRPTALDQGGAGGRPLSPRRLPSPTDGPSTGPNRDEVRPGADAGP